MQSQRPTIGATKELVARLKSGLQSEDGRPLALLCGSGLTRDAVPGTSQVIDVIRRALDDDEERQELDESLAQLNLPAEKYQRAFQFLTLRKVPSFRERIVRRIVLSAYRGVDEKALRLTEADLGALERDPSRWKLPTGVESLGRLLHGLPDNKRGPVLTTNFDPLVQIAVVRSGGNPLTYNQVEDSSFLGGLRVQQSMPAIVHLHGFWRSASTLHTVDQLSVDRPALKSALRTVLETHSLLVLGYGGWSDSVTQLLLRIIQERQSETLDVMWAMHEDTDELEDAFGKSTVLDQLQRAAPGNVTFYAGVDANVLVPLLESAVGDMLDYEDRPLSSNQQQSLVGWTVVSSAFVERHRKNSTRHDALAFFDGRLPSWDDATNPYIQPRSLTREVLSAMQEPIQTGESSYTFLLGPSGEGKSMILRQVGVLLSGLQGEPLVLHLESQDFGPIESALALDETKTVVLLIDDAANHVNQLERLAQVVREKGRHRLHVVAAAGDVDWRGRGGHMFAWSRYVRTQQFRVSGVSRADAVAIVGSWERLGEEALGALRRLENRDLRVDEIVKVAADKHGPSEGTLLGALLVTRHGEGLRQHVRELCHRLNERYVTNDHGESFTLLEAAVSVAFLHVNDVYECTYELFAASFDISEADLHANVLGLLGQEAAVSRSLGRVFVRHRLIAQVICDLAPEFGIALESIASRLVTAAVDIIDFVSFQPTLLKVAYLSKHLSHHEELRVSAAAAAVEANPKRLSYYTTLSSALRSTDSRAAAEVNRKAVPMLRFMHDPESLAGYFMEWGIAEGNNGRFALNAALVGASLRDGVFASPERMDPGWVAACYVFALTRLAKSAQNYPVLAGIKAGLDIWSAFGTRQHSEWQEQAEKLLFKHGYSVDYPLQGGAAARAKDLQSSWDFVRHAASDELPQGLFLGTGFTSVNRAADHRL